MYIYIYAYTYICSYICIYIYVYRHGYFCVQNAVIYPAVVYPTAICPAVICLAVMYPVVIYPAIIYPTITYPAVILRSSFRLLRHPWGHPGILGCSQGPLGRLPGGSWGVLRESLSGTKHATQYTQRRLSVWCSWLLWRVVYMFAFLL